MTKNYIFFFISLLLLMTFTSYLERTWLNSNVSPSSPNPVLQEKDGEISASQLSTPSMDYYPQRPPLADALAQEVVLHTPRFIVEFSQVGATIERLAFFKAEDVDYSSPFWVIQTPQSYSSQAFGTSFGNFEDNFFPSSFYELIELNEQEHKVVFQQEFLHQETRIIHTKTYFISPEDYMIQLLIEIEASGPIWENGQSIYTLYYGPQVGIADNPTNALQEYKGKTQEGKVSRFKAGSAPVQVEGLQWLAASSRYYSVGIIPEMPQNFLYYLSSSAQPPRFKKTQQMAVTRLASSDSQNFSDQYYIYVGPRSRDYLSQYNDVGHNFFRLENLSLEKILGFNWFLSPIEYLLNTLLTLFHSVVNNWGVAIILLTLFVRTLLFPLNYNMLESQMAMQRIQPKVKILQEKYKDDPMTLNMERIKLHKEEGVKIGIWGLLIQLLIFISLFSLFRNQFEFNRALFIPGWIIDLSQPDVILDFSEHFSLPLLGWTTLHILPFLNLIVQLLAYYVRVARTPQQGGMPQQRQSFMVIFCCGSVLFYLSIPFRVGSISH